MYRALRRILGAKGNWVKGNGIKGNRRHYIMRSLMFCIAQRKFAVNKIEKNEIVGACRAYGVESGIVDLGGEYWGKDTTVET